MPTTQDCLLLSAEGAEHPTSDSQQNGFCLASSFASWNWQHPYSLLHQCFCLKGLPNSLHRELQQSHI